MLIIILSVILFLIFCNLGGFHFYWFFGGTWGLAHVFPTKDDAAHVLRIPKFATLIVALALVAMGLLYLIKSGIISFALPTFITNYVYWIIPSIFILRAVGEFKYVGFFKKIKGTKFASADTKIFSPLCMVIGIIGFLIQVIL